MIVAKFLQRTAQLKQEKTGRPFAEQYATTTTESPSPHLEEKSSIPKDRGARRHDRETSSSIDSPDNPRPIPIESGDNISSRHKYLKDYTVREGEALAKTTVEELAAFFLSKRDRFTEISKLQGQSLIKRVKEVKQSLLEGRLHLIEGPNGKIRDVVVHMRAAADTSGSTEVPQETAMRREKRHLEQERRQIMASYGPYMSAAKTVADLFVEYEIAFFKASNPETPEGHKPWYTGRSSRRLREFDNQRQGLKRDYEQYMQRLRNFNQNADSYNRQVAHHDSSHVALVMGHIGIMNERYQEKLQEAGYTPQKEGPPFIPSDDGQTIDAMALLTENGYQGYDGDLG